MGSFEENYGPAALRAFTPEERTKLQELHQRLDDKFDEIASLLAAQLGYEKDDPQQAHKRAEKVIEMWEEAAELEDEPGRPADPLQCLLSEHHEIAEAIMDLRDDAIAREAENRR